MNAGVGRFFRRLDCFNVRTIGMVFGLWLGLFMIASADSANEAGGPCACSERAASATDLLPPMNGNAADFAERRAGADADARIRIAVDHQAVYQVNASDLVSRGVALSDLVGASLRLYNRDREIPIEVSTSGAFGVGDSFRFYGEGIDATYTYDNAYWLATQAPAGAAPPLRWTSVPGSMITTAGAPMISSACRQFTADDHVAKSRFLGIDDDGWALGLVSNSTSNNIFRTVPQAIPELGTPDPLGAASLSITFIRRFSADGADNVTVRNGAGTTVLSTTFANQSQVFSVPVTFTTAIPPTELDATLVFDSTDGHVYNLDQFTLRYDRVLEPLNGRLAFAGVPGGANYTIAGVGSGTPLLLDISNPSAPIQVQGALAGGTYTFGHVPVSTNAPCFFFSEQSVPVAAVDITVAECTNLADPRRQTDWILIAPEAWLGSQGAGDLLRHRAAYTNPGLPAAPLNVLAVTVESIYNEFGYGVKDAAAIKQFLGYAHHHFQAPAPRFVLLGGDASFDARQDVQLEPDWIPAWFDPEVSHAETDSWYARVAGTDRVADFAIGRWPAQSAVEFDGLAAKTIAADVQAADAFRTRVMLVNDESPQQGGMVITNFVDCTNTLGMSCVDFPAFTAGLATNVPAPYTVNVQSLATGGANVFAINSAIRGAFLGTGTPHGFIDFFGQAAKGKLGLINYSEVMLDSADVSTLSNSTFPIVNMYSSLTGQIAADNELGGRSLMTRLVVKPDGGAAGGMANTWLLGSGVAQVLQTSFYAELQSGTGQRLGDLWVAQSQAAGAVYPQPTGLFLAAGEGSFGQWTLFGDPALMLP